MTVTAPKPPTLYTIPRHVRPHKCRRCPEMIYFVDAQPLSVTPVCVSRSTGNEYHTEARAPTAQLDGLGYSHFINCPAATSFRKR